MDLTSLAVRGAETVHRAFDAYHREFRRLTRRALDRFEERDWAGIRRDTVERLTLHSVAVGAALDEVRELLAGRLDQRSTWAAMKEAFSHSIVGRDDFELAQTFFNSLSRQVFAHAGVDPAVDFVADDFPLPFKGWEMASARMYGVHRVDAATVRRVLADAGFRSPFRDLDGDAREAAERIEAGVVAALGSPRIEALDVLRPVFVRNKAAYLVGRARRGGSYVPLVLALLHGDDGLVLDAVLTTEDEASVVFSFARWYFHADVGSPREVIGFLASILPRKRISELYLSLGHTKHAKTEFYRDLVGHIAVSDDLFEVARGQRGMVMAVFTLPSYEFVFKVIRDRFAPPKATTRARVMAKYREVLLQDRVGRLVEFQEFEHLSFPRRRFAGDLLDELLAAAGETVRVAGPEVVFDHLYVERRVTPLDVYLRLVPPAEAEAVVVDLGCALKDLAAANVFPGDVLLKNFGVTRHDRVVFYDYDELGPLTDCRFRRFPQPRDPLEEMAAEPWFPVGDADVFPAEIRSFLGLGGAPREAFDREHADLFDVDFWRRIQERNRSGEVIDFFPYAEKNRLHGAPAA